MGTTLDALRAGSVSYQLVAAIEGYEHLLTSGPTAAAVTAWAGTDWTSAIGGLYLTGYNEQALDPWEPFRNAGRMSLQVVETPADGDVFGIACAKKTAGAETFLRATADRDDTTLTVADTTDFPSSGTAYIGNECFGYTGKTPTTFTGCTRGKWSPFRTQSGAGFAGYHRVGVDPQAIPLEPLVTELPRIWPGKWVGVWMHRVVGGVLDTRAQAQLIFAGRIVALYGDESGATVVEIKHVLDFVKEQTLGRDMWSARTKEGLFIGRGNRFEWRDIDSLSSGSGRDANPLIVVASGATAPNEINEGYYSLEQLNGAVTVWLQSERVAGRLYGYYTMGQAPGGANAPGIRTKIYWRIPGAGPKVAWTFAFPEFVATFLGFVDGDLQENNLLHTTVFGDDDVEQHYVSPREPLKALLAKYSSTSGAVYYLNFEVEGERGVFRDFLGYFPEGATPYNDGVINGVLKEWGLFVLDEKYIIIGAKDGNQLLACKLPRFPFSAGGLDAIAANEALERFAIPYSSDAPASIEVRQIYILEDSFEELIRLIAMSSGATGFNHPTYDTLGYGLGLGLPYELAAGIVTSAGGVPLAQAPLVVSIDEPTRFVDLFSGDFLLRRAFLRFKNNTLEIDTWKTPTTGRAVLQLGEGTKAAPGTQRESHRSASSEQGFWRRPVVKIDYSRDLLDRSKDGTYRSSITIEDKVAIDDAGGEAAAYTIKARNIFAQYVATGAALEQLVQTFIASMTLFSRDMTLVRRSIGSQHFEGLAPGDVVLLTDNFARDPDTGERGVAQRPALVTRHRATWGGRQAGSDRPAPAGGEVDLFLLPGSRVAPYVPCAQVDHTASTGGFVAGYNSTTLALRCVAHAHSESTEALDASHFATGYKVRIIEIDPVDPAAPDSWERTVATVSSNDIVLTASLSSPAWSAAKRYRVIFDDYVDATDAQRAFAFQADDADGKVANLRAPYQYGYGAGSAPYTAIAPDDPIELPPTAGYGDGVGLDVGNQAALVRLINNLLDYKTARCSPYLYNDEASGEGATGTYRLIELCPIHLTHEILGATVSRSLYVAPMFRSEDGAGASVRVSLCRSPPTDDTLDDVNRGVFSEAVFTTTSMTHAIPTPQPLTIGGLKDIEGVAWLLVELTANARCWGLAHVQEGPRT
jgi:hypothetical protein